MTRSLLLTTALLLGLPATSVLAHQVQIQDDVGATLHIEPNDIPKANAPTEIWFALTQAGGAVIPLDACDCTLTVYEGKDDAIATPALAPVSAEGYTDIPGATVTFPDVGAYTIALSGSPVEATAFAPFELRFDVTVAARAQNANPTEGATEPPETDTAESVADATQTAATATDTVDGDSATAIAETPASSSSSSPWKPILLWSSAILVVGMVWGVMGGLRSPGGKS